MQKDRDPETLQEMMQHLSNREFSAKYIIPVGQPSLLWADEFANPTRNMADVLDADQQLHEARRKTFENASGGGARFKADPNVQLTRDEQEQILAEYDANAAGAKNAGRSAWVPPGVNLDERPTARDMDYVKGSQEMRDSTLGQRGVPPAMIGLGDLSSYASIEATINGQAIIIGQPLMRLVADQLEIGLKRFFREPFNQFVIRIQANTISDPDRKNAEIEIQIGAGAVEVDEVRQQFGRKPWGGERGKAIAGAEKAEQPEAAGQPAAGPQNPLAALMTPKPQEQKPVEQAAPGEQQTVKCPVGDEIRPLDPPCECNCTAKTGDESAMFQKAFGPADQQQDLLFFRIPRELAKVVRDWQKIIVNSFPVKKVVDELHCSVLYPVLNVDTEASNIAEIVERHNPFSVVIGRLIVFRNQDADVVVMEVIGQDLHKAKRSLQNEIACGISGHLDYRPHVTLCYCKPGSVPKNLDGLRVDGLTDEGFEVTSLVLTDDGIQHSLSLGAVAPMWFEPKKTAFDSIVKGIGSIEQNSDRDENERAKLIADILFGLYGDAAERIFDDQDDEDPAISKAWDESKVVRHKKGSGRDGGRFAPKNSPENVVAVHEAINKALKGQRSAQSAKELAEMLGTLTVSQLRDLKIKFEMSASGRNKAELVEKIARRLDSGRRTPEAEKNIPELSDDERSRLAGAVRGIERSDMMPAKRAIEKLVSGRPLDRDEHTAAVAHLQTLYNKGRGKDSIGDRYAENQAESAGTVLQKLGIDPTLGASQKPTLPKSDLPNEYDPDYDGRGRKRRGSSSETTEPKPAVRESKPAGRDVPTSDRYDRDQIEYRQRLDRAEKAVAEGRLSQQKFDEIRQQDELRAAPKNWDKPEPKPVVSEVKPTPEVARPAQPETKPRPELRSAIDRAARARAEREASRLAEQSAPPERPEDRQPTAAELMGRRPQPQGETDDEPFVLQQPKKERQREDFGVNLNNRQGGLFDSGKPNELPGQNLLFNSDAGDLANPRTMENRIGQPVDARRAEILRRSPAVLREAIEERASSIGVPPTDFHQAVEEAWKMERQAHNEREAMKRTARQYTGLTLTDLKEVENGNLDHDSVPRFDDAVQAMRDEYPELSTMQDPNDYVWTLIREGAQQPKPKHHPDVLDAAEEMLATSVRGSGGSETLESGDDDFVPQEHRGWLERSFNPDRVGKRRRFWLV